MQCTQNTLVKHVFKNAFKGTKMQCVQMRKSCITCPHFHSVYKYIYIYTHKLRTKNLHIY